MPFQYANEANPRAHYEGTGAEIAAALDRVDVLVAGLGTGGTLMGTGSAPARASRRRRRRRRAAPGRGRDGPALAGGRLRAADPRRLRLDRKILVSNAESVRHLRRLLDTEGILAGVSSGFVHVALKLAGELDEGVVVCVLADAGWKEISAPFWEADDVADSMERTVWW